MTVAAFMSDVLPYILGFALGIVHSRWRRARRRRIAAMPPSEDAISILLVLSDGSTRRVLIAPGGAIQQRHDGMAFRAGESVPIEVHPFGSTAGTWP